MYGYSIGQLNIFVHSTVAGVTGEQLIWRLSGNQGNNWHRAAVAVGAAASAPAHTRSYKVSVYTMLFLIRSIKVIGQWLTLYH